MMSAHARYASRMLPRVAVLTTFLIVGAVAKLPAQQHGLRAGESDLEVDEVFPGSEPVDAAGEDTIWCVLLVDAFDRRPLPGALVQVPWHPHGGVVDAELHHQCVGIADDYGWVRLPWAATYGYRDYVFAEAPGYVPDEDCLPGNVMRALRRGIDVPVELVDYTGRPVPNGRLELVLGCGHVPPQRTVVADGQGRAMLRDVDPGRHEDFFVWAPGCHYGAHDLRHTWRTGDPPVPIDVVPGCTAAGRVVDGNGRPVPGVRVGPVGEYGEHQRPWARTDRDGRFALVGLEAWQTLAVEPPAHLGLGSRSITTPPVGVACTIVLGRSETTCDVLVQVAATDGQSAADVRIVATRSTDGMTFTDHTDERGKVHLMLPVGDYMLRGDGELGRYGRCEHALVVADDKPETVQLVVPTNPTVTVDTSRIDGMTFGITTGTGYRELETSAEGSVEIPFPVDERATFRISHRNEGDLVVRFVEIPGPGQTMVLEGPPETMIRARFVGPDGRPVPASLRLERGSHGDSFRRESTDGATPTGEVATSRVGTMTWIASPNDERLALRLGDVVVGRGDVDLGEIRFELQRAPDVTVVLPAELKEAAGSVHGQRAGGTRSTIDAFDEDGVIASGFGDFIAGDMLWIEPDEPGAVPFPFVVPGPPPWTVNYPTTSLTLSMRSAASLPATYMKVFVDGTEVRWNRKEEPELRLRGLAPGEHTLVVAEGAHLARRLRLLMLDGEQRSLEVLMNPRQR